MSPFFGVVYTQNIGTNRFVKNSSKSYQNDKILTSSDSHIDEHTKRMIVEKSSNVIIVVVTLSFNAKMVVANFEYNLKD